MRKKYKGIIKENIEKCFDCGGDVIILTDKFGEFIDGHELAECEEIKLEKVKNENIT